MPKGRSERDGPSCFLLQASLLAAIIWIPRYGWESLNAAVASYRCTSVARYSAFELCNPVFGESLPVDSTI